MGTKQLTNKKKDKKYTGRGQAKQKKYVFQLVIERLSELLKEKVVHRGVSPNAKD